jgi:twitching motility protein PilT
MDFNELLISLLKKTPRISDIHFKSGRPPMTRITGQLMNSDYPVLSDKHTHAIAKALLTPRQWEEFQKGKAIDLSYQIKGHYRFRVNVFHQRGSCEITMRVVPLKVPKIEELRLPEVLKKIAMEERGMVLVTGSAGCGKSTTLAAMIQYANENFKGHIITIEDPIEFYYDDAESSVDQIEVGTDVISFHKALRSSLRQDPDIILVGEMRDLETIDTAIKAAETGHLVFSTLHTTDATKTITRIIDQFPPHQHMQVRYQLAANLKAIISQRLLVQKNSDMMVPAVEILVATVTIQQQIIDPQKTIAIRDTISRGRSQYQMQTLDQHLTDLYNDDPITLETALTAATNPSDFQRALQFE